MPHAYFKKLKRHQESLRRKMGMTLEWELREDQNHCRVLTSGDFSGWDEQKWPDYYRWFERALKNFQRAFRGPVEAMVGRRR